MEKRALMIIVVIVMIVLFGNGVYAAADFAIYNGAGTWEPSKTAFKNFLEWKGLSWEHVSKNDINKGKLIGNYLGLFMPGGWAGDYNRDIKSSGDQHIRNFISQGGGYIGMSAGAFYACDVTIWEGNVYDYPSNIFDGDCIGPIEEIAPWPEYVMTTMDIEASHEVNLYEPAQRNVLYYGEPYFVAHSGQEMLTMARWIVPSNPIADGAPGIISFNYGQGRVILVGPHPEIEEDDTRDGTDFADELSDGPDGSDWPLLWTGVDWILGNPISQPPGTQPKQCNDGTDNDSDGLIDYPEDPGCDDFWDDDETDPLPPQQCENGQDDDGDGYIDYPEDFGCSSEVDNDETNNGLTQCSNGLDDDGDGLSDHEDPGCFDYLDDDETDPTGPQELFFDGFEDGFLDGWTLYGPGSQWSGSGESVFEGSYAARAKKTGAGKNSYMEISIDGSGYSDLTFEYYRRLKGLDAADDFRVEYFANGQWYTLEHLGSDSENNANFVFKQFSILPSAEKIRFMCECGAVSEKCYVDNVRILGQ
jgi:glutamine amidotransferase-like uncharacterized protein